MAALLTMLLLIPSTTAHVAMSWPYPLRSKLNPSTPQSMIDYNMIAPLEASGADFPCKGYQSNTPLDVVTTYTAGTQYNMSVTGSATHRGGSCQLSLSYDMGKTFKVIKSMIGGCPLQSTYDFTIPADAPAGNALFAWTWSNFMGNREFYMNCASVHINGAMNMQQRDTAVSFANRPNIWVADLASINKCTTDGPDGSLNAVYPDPGPDVVYGGGMSSSSPPTSGNCEVPAVARQVLAPSISDAPSSSSTLAPPSFTYSPASATDSSSMSIASAGTVGSSNLSTSAAPNYQSSTPASTTLTFTHSGSSVIAASTSLSSLSTVTMTMDCPSTITVTIPPTVYPATYTISSPTSACTGTTAVCPCNTGYSCMAMGSCTWACMAMPATTLATFQTSLLATTTQASPSTTVTSTGMVMTTTAASPPGQNPVGYVDASNLQAYLPCVPGTFICTDPSTWYTCDQQVGGGWTYQYPRQVAAGMQCQPYLSPSSSAPTNGQQGSTPQGYYRDDRYVRAYV